ncbi:MAG: antibiotic biosynthesis monooxygenase [Colwellia polaris]|jgi:quinol monooxygenase YgiN|uniref:putative quinol monooxygenase n=1 Tax=Colwellia polaris TaxID=326537 RepID=UPI000A175477|nr:antibiotic biosynthesis monooxygenase [Colwellia polaris]|tara:strand:+ start:17753 stop:18382 length:630 start_codon:yes stop_codon:yes gene_type:complete
MITQIVKFDIKPEQIETFKAALVVDKQGAESEQGCLELRLFQDKNQAGVFFAYERFQDQAALDYHAEQSYVKNVLGMLESASKAAPTVMVLNNTAPTPLHESNTKKVHEADDVFSVFFIFDIKPAYRQQLLTRFESHVENTRQEQGNLVFDLYTIDGKDDTLVIYEHWRKESDLWDIHFNQPYAIETGALLNEAVVGDLKQYMSFVEEF